MPDDEKIPLELTGEQLNLAYQILTQERTRTFFLGVDHTARDEIIAEVYDALKRSGYREQRDEKIQKNREKYKRHTEILRAGAIDPQYYERKAEIQNLGKPECTFGYTDEQVTRIMGARLYDFRRWIDGQTGGVCDGEGDCGPHGFVTPRQDVERFLLGLPVVD